MKGVRFKTAAEVLAYYESQAPVLTPGFVAEFPWAKIKDSPLERKWIDVLLYMRNIEKFTDIYYRQLMASPSGKDPVISQFMQRWKTEEDQHAELIHRFLVAVGAVDANDAWYAPLRNSIPRYYFLKKRLTFAVTDLFGRYFIGTHMAWGAINEFSTLQGYHRLARLCGHPVLAELLRAIAAEEARHAFFYYHIAALHLAASHFAQAIARFALRYFWAPVGHDLMPMDQSKAVITALFTGPEGIDEFDRMVSRRIRDLKGLENLDSLTQRVAAFSL